ncbi:SufE family protein [Pelagibacteraceae bacterium]|nr:SufE family protein [Pelagibacteraceae bacterium]
MLSIEDKIKKYKEDLDFFDDQMDKYKFLIDQGKNAKPFPEEFKTKEYIVSGCQAQVWLVPSMKNNKINFIADSDAFISKGMVTILCDIYSDREIKDIVSTDFNLIKELDLDILLTPGRRNGVFSMMEKIKQYANSYS